jgi:hypothetical protein
MSEASTSHYRGLKKIGAPGPNLSCAFLHCAIFATLTDTLGHLDGSSDRSTDPQH